MINKIKTIIKKNTEIFALSLLIFITIIATSYYNYTKAKVYSNYKNITNNIYLQKTINYFFDNLEPKFKKINHQVSEGETFNNIFLKKTITHLFDNLEPKFKKINHKISAGETFDNILELYSINQIEISQIKKKLSKKIDLK